jgi:3-hydroxyacyl-CoA dehydrogenase / enoyl-CoA hydratase / 3-hydroxybutyryl-CoA epimerase
MSTIHWDRDADGIVVLTLDDPGQSANTMNAAYAASMAAAVDRLEAERDTIAGVVLTSGKKTFFAGGDLNDLKRVTPESAVTFGAFVRDAKATLRRLETLGVPVVAAINGAALGGGLEICLACHRRVIVDDRRAVVGFPEVTLGLLPGGGGVVRTVRLVGVESALNDWLLTGQRHAPAKAVELGLVDEVIATLEDLVPAAKAWIHEQDADFAGQPWDRSGAKPDTGGNLPALAGRLAKQLKGANVPAPKAILAAAVEGAQVDFDTALEIEGRYFLGLAAGQVAKNMIQAFFFDAQTVNGDRGRSGDAPFRASKVLVLGAGMMGTAIAYVCAKSGLEVVLKDTTLMAAQRGRAYSEKLVARGRGDKALVDRIHPTDQASDAQDADLVIEAVFEDPAVKAKVFAEIEPYLAPDALLGSNTSTLPITDLAQHVTRPADFIGLHFFSPVDRMPLLEIIKGGETSETTLHRALDVARQIGKTPIVVNDSRGFFTSRVIQTFIHEGITMLLEGVPAPSIEQASSHAGYPAPVLQLADEVNLKLMVDIRDAAQAASAEYTAHPAFGVMDPMLAAGRSGKAQGAGFYEYVDGRRGKLWSGLRDLFPPVADPSAIPLVDLSERMLFAEALETVRCVDEGVIESVAEANVGSILGIGFPGWTGGVLQYVNGYSGGVAGFVARARELATAYGERFTPPPSLVEKAERGEIYTDAGALEPA